MDFKIPSKWNSGTGSATRVGGDWEGATRPPIQPSLMTTSTSADTYSSSFESTTTPLVDLSGSGKTQNNK